MLYSGAQECERKEQERRRSGKYGVKEYEEPITYNHTHGIKMTTYNSNGSVVDSQSFHGDYREMSRLLDDAKRKGINIEFSIRN